jgi:hypothetical protein
MELQKTLIMECTEYAYIRRLVYRKTARRKHYLELETIIGAYLSMCNKYRTRYIEISKTISKAAHNNNPLVFRSKSHTRIQRNEELRICTL